MKKLKDLPASTLARRGAIALGICFFALFVTTWLIQSENGSSEEEFISTRSTVYVDSIRYKAPNGIHEEINAPEYIVYWSNGRWSTSRRPYDIGDSVEIITLTRKAK